MLPHMMKLVRYPPERLKQLIWAKERAQKAQVYYEDVGSALVLDIIDGETTGNHILDFVLVACSGTYDPSIIELYQDFHDVILGNPHHALLVVQEAEHWYEDELYVLRNVFVGELRLDTPEFNIDKQLIGIPVERGYLVWREVLKHGVITDVPLFVEENVMYVGPIENTHCGFGNAYSTAQGTVMVPSIAPSAIYVHPWDSKHLERRHGIDHQLYQQLMQSWVVQKTKLIARP